MVNIPLSDMDGLQVAQQFFGNVDEMSLEQDELVMNGSDQFTGDVRFLNSIY